MTDLTPQVSEGRATIVSYGRGGFRLTTGGSSVEGTWVEGPLLIGPEGPMPWDRPALDPDGLARLAQTLRGQSAEVLLLGCGATGQFVPPALRQLFRSQGLVVDAMDSGAACRTFNVLMTEDRRALAAILPVV